MGQVFAKFKVVTTFVQTVAQCASSFIDIIQPIVPVNETRQLPQPQPSVIRISGVGAERARGEWPDLLPLVLRSASHSIVSKGRFDQTWSKRLTMIKWVISGEAAMRVNGRRIPFGPGDVAIHVPTMQHAFWATEPHTEICWLSIDGPLAEQFVHLLGVRGGVYPYGPPPVERIDEMVRSLGDQSIAGQRHSSLLAIQMLYDVIAHLPLPQTPSIVRQVLHQIEEGVADPDLSAKGIAARLNYNRGALSRLFHQQTGTTIIECITQSRLAEAEMLLKQTDERIGDIARKCGFRDISYFTRWVKKHTGRLPKRLRDTGSANPRHEM